MIIVSACLSGVKCRYDGQSRDNECVKKLVGQRKAIPLCPEVLGGRPVPREPVEITGGTAEDVFSGKAVIRDKNGADVTTDVMKGVAEVLAAVRRLNIDTVVLKTKSPTCGCGQVYDGTFSGKLIDGDGILTAALIKEGIKVYTEESINEILDTL